jgi:hypothetical protein
MWSVPDLRSFLSGAWHVDRRLFDRSRSIAGELKGEAHFTPSGRCLIYGENGTFIFGAHRGAAEQRLSYEFPWGNAQASVKFRDGRPFHVLDLSDGQAVVTHSCGRDHYEGCFAAIGPGQWKSAWNVSGPRKDQEIATLYTRIC